jgi:hypothetical protein
MTMAEMVHDARIIPIFNSSDEAKANHGPAEMKRWFSDSVGWYEQGYLVVETISRHPLQVSQSSIPITKDGKITERFTR